jgi:(5-formylfuran-3-yl)methyl phosphate synthase
MRLLVSVRSAEEVAAALAGGADIVDAKEPARGSLGAVTAAVLSAIAARTPAWVPLSVALGDCTGLDELHASMDASRIAARRAPVYLKLGFAGTRSFERITALLQSAVANAGPDGIVAVGYADHGSAETRSPEEVLRAAVKAGARGFLVDTWRKDERALLDHLSVERLASLSVAARAAGLLVALAGSLDGDAIARLAGLADVVGVRGAACRGGRSGEVDAGRVAELRRRVGPAAAPAPLR